MKSDCKFDASIATKSSPSRQTLHRLDWLNFLLADVQSGVRPFLAIYLAGYKWNEESAGVALAAFSLLYLFMPETRNTRPENAGLAQCAS
jgi:hypothetical protein